MRGYRIRRLFKKLKERIEEVLGVNNKVSIEYVEQEDIMNIEINSCGFQAHFSYRELEDETKKDYHFIFDRGVHPVVIAHLVNLGREVFGNIVILDPYFVVGKERYTGSEAEEMYNQWLATDLMENSIFSNDVDGETVH